MHAIVKYFILIQLILNNVYLNTYSRSLHIPLNSHALPYCHVPILRLSSPHIVHIIFHYFQSYTYNHLIPHNNTNNIYTYTKLITQRIQKPTSYNKHFSKHNIQYLHKTTRQHLSVRRKYKIYDSITSYYTQFCSLTLFSPVLNLIKHKISVKSHVFRDYLYIYYTNHSY